ncbi:MAG: hypothetical protein EBR82_74420 [Caulobacteraceae bacterium]|nr:hypothetical protein [Caulobacteraceae bacterium]
MTKLSQLSIISGSALADDDQFFLRDVSDATTPNKALTLSGLKQAIALAFVGTDPEDIPLNQYLGDLAFLDSFQPTIVSGLNVVSGVASTGIRTATFSATNAPGASSVVVRQWLPVVVTGVTHYLPLFAP